METSWVDLLDKNGLKSPQRTRVTVKVSDSTPRGKVGTKWNTPNSYLLHRTTPTGSRELGTGEKLLMESQRKLRESQLQYKEVCVQLQQQTQLIEQLTADNHRLVAQIEGQSLSTSSHHDQLQQALKEKNNLLAELERTKSSLALAQLTATQLEKNLNEKAEELEGILAHMHSLRSEVHHLSAHQHGSKHLLTDMERLTRHNAELCERLTATQHSRTVLERDMVAIKRALLEEKAVNSKLESVLAKTIDERDELGSELDGKLKSVLENLQHERLSQESTVERLHEEKDELLIQVENIQQELEESRSELASLKETQLREIERRCLEVDSMKSQLEQELTNLQTERREFSQQLHEVEKKKGQFKSRLELSSRQLDQLTSENQLLVSQLEQVRRKSDTEQNSLERANKTLQDQLEQTASDFENVLADAESTKTSNILLQQQVSDLTAQVSGMKEQLSGRCELTNEMKALLDQRAARIRELEKTVAKQKKELSVSMETTSEIFNASRESQDDILSECSSTTSLSPGRPRSSRFTSSHAEVIHLKRRLAESRRQAVCLEVQLAQVKTDNAKLLGSQQALSSIKDHLTKENGRLTSAIKKHLEAQEMADKEKEDLRYEVNQLHLQVSNLERETDEEKENILARVSELEHISSGHEVDHTMMERLLEEERHKAYIIQQDLSVLSQLVDKEAAILRDETHQCADTVSALRTEAMQLQETSRITEVVNSTRAGQIQEREESVSCLLGEVEALRAKKSVVEKFLQEKTVTSEQQHISEHKQLLNEVSELRDQLKNCTCNHSDGVSHDMTGHTHQGRFDRLLSRLKSQKRQTNFVRMKLGYALSELRLYKQLKVAMDDQVAKLQESVLSVQDRYHHCLERLKQAEELGFGIIDQKTTSS